MKEKLKKVVPIIVLIAITLTIALLSYDNPFNKIETGADSKVFRQVVNVMNHGGAPYRDVFDHKGPILYIIDWIGIKLTLGNIDGIWLMQCIAIFITVFFTYKTLTKRFNLNIIEALVLTFLTNINILFFLQEGNLTETYALPLITATLYMILTLNSLNYKKYNFLIGMCMGIVAFLRVNMISIWIVYYIYVLISCIKNKQFKQLLNIIKYAFLGVLSITVIVGLYLIISGSLEYCIKDYLLFNIKYGTKNVEGIKTAFQKFMKWGNMLAYYLIIISFGILLLRREKFLGRFSIAYFCLTVFLIVQPGKIYGHYGTVVIPTYIIPLAYLYTYVKNIKSEGKLEKIVKIIKYVIVLIMIVALLYVPLKGYYKNFVAVNITENDLSERTKMIENIKENTNENDTILVIGNDCDIYTLTDRKSASRYIFQYPIYESDSSILPQVAEDINNNKPKYLIIVKIHKTEEIVNFVYEVTNDKYTKVDENNRYEIYQIR